MPTVFTVMKGFAVASEHEEARPGIERAMASCFSSERSFAGDSEGNSGVVDFGSR